MGSAAFHASTPSARRLRRGSRSRRDDGLSLIEVLVAVAIVGGLAVGMMGFVISSVRMNKIALERSTATSIATSRMEQVMSEPFHGSGDAEEYALPEETFTEVTAGETYTYETDAGDIPDFPDDPPGYRRTVTIDYNEPVTSMMRVEVVVEWDNLNQGVKTHRVITYLHGDLEAYQ